MAGEGGKEGDMSAERAEECGVVSSSCGIHETLAGGARRAWRGSEWWRGPDCFDGLGSEVDGPSTRATIGRGQHASGQT